MMHKFFNDSRMDIFEKILLLIGYIFFLIRIVTDMLHSGSTSNLIYFFDQTIIVIFLLIRRQANSISHNYADWFLGLISTFLPLLIVPAPKTDATLTLVSTLIMLIGIVIHLTAKLILRRSFGVVAANRGVKIEGPYRLVRHPMYLGYMILQFGFLLTGWNTYNVMIIAICWILFVYRMIAEEKILLEDTMYQAFSAKVKYRLIPGIY